MSTNVIEILTNCQLFSQVSNGALARLVTIARLCNFAKGELIVREGHPCPGVYVVGSGLVRVFKTGPAGKEHVLHLVGPGNTFAEVAAVGQFDMPASAQAVTDTVCALLPGDRFHRMLQEDHQFCLALLGGMAGWVRYLVRLLEDLVLRDASGRVARYLLALPADQEGLLELPAPKRHVANHLNLTSETFSRTWRRLIETGLIEELHSGKVRLLDAARLQRVADGLFPEY